MTRYDAEALFRDLCQQTGLQEVRLYVDPFALDHSWISVPADRRIQAANFSDGTYAIRTTTEFLEPYSEDEVRGWFLHEMGHIALGHLDELTGPARPSGVFNSITKHWEWEFAADAFAALYGGKDGLVSGLTKTPGHVSLTHPPVSVRVFKLAVMSC